jgi:hypothetical protein
VSRPTEFAEVAAAVEQFGPLATLVTVNADGAPHVGTVLVGIADEHLTVQVGSSTRENVLARPALSLAWLDPDRDYQLILDGSGTVGEAPGADGVSAVTVRVERGILHRLAGRPEAGPSCLELSQQRA